MYLICPLTHEAIFNEFWIYIFQLIKVMILNFHMSLIAVGSRLLLHTLVQASFPLSPPLSPPLYSSLSCSRQGGRGQLFSISAVSCASCLHLKAGEAFEEQTLHINVEHQRSR